MKKAMAFAIRLYGWLISFYPREFLSEFRDEMVGVFTAMLLEAAGQGAFPLIKVCLRELRDFPLNLLRAYLKEESMVKVLRSQPVGNSLRLALGFGVAGTVGNFLSWLLFLWLLNPSIAGELQLIGFNYFHTDGGPELISWFFSAIGSLLAGLVLGILFAALFAERSKRAHYILAAMFGWFLHDVVSDTFMYSANLGFFLGARQVTYFYIALSILSGAFLGLIFVVAKSERRAAIRLLAAGAILYPLLAFLYVKLLFKLFIVTNPSMFIALLGLVAVYMVSVFLLAIKNVDNQKLPWLVVAGALGYPILRYVAAFLASRIYLPTHPMEISWSYIIDIALYGAVYGVLFGLLFGLLSSWSASRGNTEVVA